MTAHYTLFSGGAGSWKTAKIVQANLQPGDTHQLVFTDVLYEDADLYRFLIEGAANIFGRWPAWAPAAEDFPDYRVDLDAPIEAYSGNPAWRAMLAQLRARAQDEIPELIWLTEGRDPWEIYRDERFLGNSNKDPCSKFGKRRPLDRWRKTNCDPASSIFYVGIGEHEAHRYDDGKGYGIRPRMAKAGWDYRAPLGAATAANGLNPLISLDAEGIRRPRLYARGYIHNNCGGFCCKAGHAHYLLRLREDPERFAYDAAMEEKIRAFLGADVSMLTDRAGDGEKKMLTLLRFRERVRAQPQLDLLYQAGDSGCGCMLDGDD